MSQQPVATRRRQQHNGQPRRIPSQQRGRERFEKILAVASELIESHGSDGLKMSEIVEKAGLSFGALYQYFPDKSAIIRTLAERFNEEGRRCVEAELAEVTEPAALTGALANIADEYYAFFRREPVMRDIWHATHTDKLLQQIDAEDMQFHAQAFLAVLVRLRPDRDRSELLAIARLTMHLLAAAVRYAVSLNAAEGDAAIALFKKMQGPDIGRLLGE
ncbi:TetR family transcriptional regulator [Rhizobium chutanense]|uniref:TetR family transcriptional regulator n=1 Tax=Rhizobium chutanense TaxID=2035448 RepID=A0A2A6J3S8_9HYPH|nr:TetR/AcrR family transcriptional regulator [Rhizobium chutanense]PDT00849.1 TetR family transcriptional regulator [Rhizobium chutanense]